MQISYSYPLSRAWQRARLILFSPFDLGKWLVLAFSAWLANLAGGGGGGGIRGRFDINGPPDVDHVLRSFEHGFDWIGRHTVWLPLMGLGMLLVLGLLLLVLWVSSRAKFVFLDNVVHDRAEIVAPWKRFRDQGNSLFVWRVGFTLAVLLAASVVTLTFLGLTALMGRRTGWAFVLPPGILLVLVLAAVVLYVDLFLEGFVIPIMYRFELSATEAWSVFLEWWHRYPGPFIVYGLLVLGLWILFGISVAVIGFATCCIAFFFLMLPYVGTLLTLPAWVTYRALSIEFLAQFDPRFDLFAAALEDGSGAPGPGAEGDAPTVPQTPPPPPPAPGSAPDPS